MQPDPNPRAYQAIDPQDKTRRDSLELRLKDGRRYWLKHADRHLMALSPDQTALTLFFYSMSVVIQGRNLAEVATAIDGRNTPYLCEYHAAKWDKPIDLGAPFIESMQLYQPKAEEDGGQKPGAASLSASAAKQPH
jgi:hypothetical protein